jgi:DNA-binding MarR family transcriptional regulator
MTAAVQGAAPGMTSLIREFVRSDTRTTTPDDEKRLSRSLLRGLSLLTCFSDENESRGIVELADELEMSPSTAHRYAMTLVHLGLLERSPHNRKYGLPTSATR